MNRPDQEVDLFLGDQLLGVLWRLGHRHLTVDDYELNIAATQLAAGLGEPQLESVGNCVSEHRVGA